MSGACLMNMVNQSYVGALVRLRGFSPFRERPGARRRPALGACRLRGHMDDLPGILEVKRTLYGREKRFQCRLIDFAVLRDARGEQRHAVVLFVAAAAMHVHGVDLPAGTVSIGHFWTDRPYNVYHWLRGDRTTVGYYFNLADRTTWTAERLDWRDLTVDVLATPEGRLDVLDEDELPAELDAEASAHIEAGKAALLGVTAPRARRGRGGLARRAAARGLRLRAGRAVKTVVQRVTRASVRADGVVVGEIARGVMLLVGVEKGDLEADADTTARKLAALRLFPGQDTHGSDARRGGRRVPRHQSIHALRVADEGQPTELRARRGARARRGPLPARRRGPARRGPRRRDRALRR